ncbi:TIGR04295 family B12-binding domain-containing radical SAM protein [Pendulispora albinea]|uniref:TIGR04295 family B12-binding domain-containing radical SAM protein n=1 Tax=Pendulispora albinea TaxID=2741071 RepID=A0ABZ2LXM9_9BACT
MKVALVNPRWAFDGSIYFGCRAPHLPLEFGYSKALLEQEGHSALLIDAQLHALELDDVRSALRDFEPDMIVLTTAPSYLFWRCAPPELRIPRRTADAIRDYAPYLVVVGPHASTTPRATLRKLGADVAVLGECEEILVQLASTPPERWRELSSIAYREDDGRAVISGKPHAADMTRSPVLVWPDATIASHLHHHHRFDQEPDGPGAEVETSRGCPYHCTFCAKDNFRDRFRKRPLHVVLEEVDRLVAQGVRYIYFIDEIFVPDRPLLEALIPRRIAFGVQMRIDNWSKEMLALLGAAGCVSIEAGVESISPQGRSLLAKRCKLSTPELTELLLLAKRHVAFVQANLLDGKFDDPQELARWRDDLSRGGVWSNDPVPLFAYPGSPEYTLRWGPPDDVAWERAHADYLERFRAFSDIQEQAPASLDELES